MKTLRENFPEIDDNLTGHFDSKMISLHVKGIYIGCSKGIDPTPLITLWLTDGTKSINKEYKMFSGTIWGWGDVHEQYNIDLTKEEYEALK